MFCRESSFCCRPGILVRHAGVRSPAGAWGGHQTICRRSKSYLSLTTWPDIGKQRSTGMNTGPASPTREAASPTTVHTGSWRTQPCSVLRVMLTFSCLPFSSFGLLSREPLPLLCLALLLSHFCKLLQVISHLGWPFLALHFLLSLRWGSEKRVDAAGRLSVVPWCQMSHESETLCLKVERVSWRRVPDSLPVAGDKVSRLVWELESDLESFPRWSIDSTLDRN